MRGRLISPVMAEIYPLDTTATSDIPEGTNYTSGYDEDFREGVLVDRDGDGIGQINRVEGDPISVPAQLEVSRFSDLGLFSTGKALRAKIVLVFDRQTLEDMNLIDENGHPRIRIGYRLGSLSRKDGSLLYRFDEANSLYVTEVRPTSQGFIRSGGGVNLVLVEFGTRKEAI